MRFKNSLVFASAILALASAPLAAQVDRSPDLGTTVPSSWTTDRYEPCGFGLVNGFQGRNNVLKLSTCAAGAAANRPPAYSSTFYDTQGRQIAIDGVNTASPSNQFLSFDMWIDQEWATSSGRDGVVSVGMWSRVNQVATDLEADAYYPIMNFSNSSGVGMFRYFDSDVGYIPLLAGVNYGAWNNVRLGFTGNMFTASVNGVQYYSHMADPGTTRLTSAFGQIYNNGTNGYDAHFSNVAMQSVVPEPSTYAMMGIGLVGMGAFARRRKQRVA